MEWTKNIDWNEFLERHNIHIKQGEKQIIITEGPDGGGKSTTIDILLDVIKHCFVLHTSAPPKDSSPEYYQGVLNASLNLIKQLNQPIIVDRFHYGEKVYGNIFRGYDIDISTIERELEDLNAKTIYITANTDVLIERLKSRGDWYVKPEDISPIIQKYNDVLFINSNMPLYIFDTTEGITEDKIADLLKFIYK